MANPSLQIGNDNWAIKEDNLLGYSTAGTRFVPQPITMTRATLGTRVNPSGLVEDVELLGSELVTNGDFATDSDWTKGTGWTISGGNANSDGSGTSFLYQIISNAQTKRFLIEYEVKNYVSGSVSIVLGSAGSDQLTSSSNGVVSGIVLWDGTSDRLNFKSVSLNGSIDNVSVKEATIDNLPRVDYTDGTSSLLVEPLRTNLITYSEDFSQSDWTKQGATTISATNITSPIGTTNATRITGLTGSGSNDLKFITGIDPANKTYTATFYLKGSNTLRMQLSNGIDDAVSTTIILTSSWVRYSITHTFNSTSSDLRILLDDNGVTATTYDVWGSQLEAGSYPTSYIKTSGSTVTRNQETYTKTGISDLINSEEGVLFVEMAALSDDLSYRQISLSDGTSNNRIYLQYNAVSNNIAAVVKVGGSTTAYTSTTLSSSNITDFNKIGFKWKLNDFALWINGVEVSTDTSGGVPTGLNEFTFNQTSSDFYGKVKQLQVFKTALSDSELATLTT